VGELLLREHRGLFLELHFLNLAARRVELLLSQEPRLFAGAQRSAERLDRVARQSQRLLGEPACTELPLQRLFDGRPVNRCTLAGRLLEQRLLLGDLCNERLTATRELRDPVATAALCEIG